MVLNNNQDFSKNVNLFVWLFVCFNNVDDWKTFALQHVLDYVFTNEGILALLYHQALVLFIYLFVFVNLGMTKSDYPNGIFVLFGQDAAYSISGLQHKQWDLYSRLQYPYPDTKSCTHTHTSTCNLALKPIPVPIPMTRWHVGPIPVPIPMVLFPHPYPWAHTHTHSPVPVPLLIPYPGRQEGMFESLRNAKKKKKIKTKKQIKTWK